MSTEREGGGGRGRRRGMDNGFDAWGGYMAAKKAKLKEQFRMDQMANNNGNVEGIFEGVAIYVNGYTGTCSNLPTADELKRIMMVNGGTYHHYMDSSTTHIIASNLPDTKVKALKGNEVIVKPEWIVECLKQQRIIDYSPFLLYTRESCAQTKIDHFAIKRPIESGIATNGEFEAKTISVGDHSARTANTDKLRAEGGFKEDNGEERTRVMDANDARFLSSYYNNSRLHHISTMGAEMKRYVIELRAKNEAMTFPRREELQGLDTVERCGYDDRIVLHIDMDCFFVSVGLISRPNLRNKPIAVAHARKAPSASAASKTSERYRAELEVYVEKKKSKNSGKGSSSIKQLSSAEIASMAEEFTSMSELASVSYEARQFGVKNGMFLGPALKLCPNLTTIPYDFEAYKRISKKLYDIVAEYTLEIMAISCDELVVDITDLLGTNNKDWVIDPMAFVKLLRNRIKNETQCNASIGIGPSLLLARMALRKAKPDNFFFLGQKQAQNFMQDVSVRDLPGVGRSMQKRLQAEGIESCGELQRETESRLVSLFGVKTGKWLFDACRGLDRRQLETTRMRKSVSAEVNYGIRFTSEEDCNDFLNRLAVEVQQRLLSIQAVAKTITLKVMVRSKSAPRETSKFLGHGVCDSYSKSSSLSSATSRSDIIQRESKNLMRSMHVDPRELRGIGIQMTKLEHHSIDQSISSSNSKVDVSDNKGSILAFLRKGNDSGPVNKNFTDSTGKDRVKIQADEGHKQSDHKAQSSHESLGDFSFSQIDASVLNALPENIREEVLTTCKRRSAASKGHEEMKDQTNKAASTVHFSSNKKVPTVTVVNKVNTCEKTKNDKSNGTPTPSLAQYSLSQIDSSVLTSLPESIQEEVLASCKSGKEILNNESKDPRGSNIESAVVIREICVKSNNWPKVTNVTNETFEGSSKDSKTINDKESKPQESLKNASETEPMPAPVASTSSADYSFSQLDTSVLNSLPESIQQEVFANCQRRKEISKVVVKLNKEEENVSSFSQIDPEVFGQLPEEMKKEIQLDLDMRRASRANRLAAPKGSFLPPTTSGNSRGRVVKPRRGRPPKHLPSASSKQRTPSLKGKSTSKTTSGNGHSRTDDESKEDRVEEKFDSVHLNGARTSEDVCNVLHTWIANYDLPTSDDVETVKEYVCKLITDLQDLDQTCTVLRFLQRNLLHSPLKVDENERVEWRQAFLSIAKRAQRLVQERHGATLNGIITVL